MVISLGIVLIAVVTWGWAYRLVVAKSVRDRRERQYLLGEHFLQYCQHFALCSFFDLAQEFH